MNDRELYKLSSKLNLVVNEAKHLLTAHGTRYKHFVDSGDRGFECVYARQTSRRYHEDDGDTEVRTLLLGVVEACGEALAYLDGQGDTKPPVWLQEMNFQDRHVV